MTRLECGRHACARAASPLHVFIALLTLLQTCAALGSAQEAGGFLGALPQYEVVRPTRVDARGHFLSNFLSHHARRVQRREAPEGPADSDRVFYQLWHGGHSLNFNLTLNPHLLAPGFLTERRYGGLQGAQIRPPASTQCYFLGEVWDGASVKGSAAISTCDGLTGLFDVSEEEFFIQPLEKSRAETTAPQAHAVYKRHAPPRSWSPLVQTTSGNRTRDGTCGLKSSHQSLEDVERRRERWERRQRRRRRIRHRSVSNEKWVETLVVADPKMVEYHGSKAAESYVLAIMNIVAGLFRDASIGNAINIAVVRLVLLEEEEDELKITHHADNSLNSFCKWQKKLNMKEEHPLHHDVAVLITRKDICAAINMPCETLGLSHVAGMCQSHRSCSISEDTGLPLAFTVAHELGHNFGIQHDGNGNDCEPIGKRPFVMSPQLLYGTSLPRWSRCSRQYITRFLDRGWGWCLDDAPVKDKLAVNPVLPGVLYSAAHQCRLQYGSGSLLCDDMDNVCSTLWCTVGTTCHSKLDGAADGTSCGDDKWCFSGECVPLGLHPESVNGGWASWSEWSGCSRTCGAGVRSAHRDCDNPVPKYRGKYCLGERRRYKVCNISPCPHDLPTFRSVQCSHFNSMPYKGKFYKWESVINRVNPCELHCRPLNEHFSEKMRDAVIDGTPCYEGNKSRDMCVNGICKKLGCDYVIDSSAVEDRCGVCHGNGSTCTTVKKTFEETEGLGYVDIGLIPEGAWDIRIEEVAEAGNFLALRSDNPNKYFLNGGWTIQWNGEYKAAGTVFTYVRTGHLENLTSPGPTMEPLWIQLLFQETNPGVRYEYTISQNTSQDNATSVFSWKYGSWTECSVTCGAGVQRQIVHCVEKTTGIVDEQFCDPSTRPDDNRTSCNKDPCPATWWVGEWQKCSSSCGSSGLAKRTVLCIQAVSVEEQKALQPSECEHMSKPESLSSCNTHIPCPADWSAGSWSKCSLTCGGGLRRRDVTCSRNTGVDCDPGQKPPAVSSCNTQSCPPVVENFGGNDWSGSGWPSEEVLNEIHSIPEVKPASKHSTTRAQPRAHHDLTNTVEGDFHYHNNIENIHHSTVQVDDFYYDYNFINFHEDLSDDFEGDGGDSEDTSTSSDDTHTESTKAPTAASDIFTISKATAHTVDTGNLDSAKDAENSEDLDDFLSEDYFLPVSVTRPPPVSTTQHSPTLNERGDSVWWPENSSTRPSLGPTTEQPTQGVPHRQYVDEVDNSYDYFTEEDTHTLVTVTPTPRNKAGSVSSTVSRLEEEEEEDYYDDNEYRTPGPDFSADPGDEEPVEPLSSPMPEIIIHVQTGVPLDERAPEIPQTITPVTSEDPYLDRTHLNAVFATNEGEAWGSDPHLSTTWSPASQSSTAPPSSTLHISGNGQASTVSTSLPGTDITPPTDLEGTTRPSPAGLLPAVTEQIPTQTAVTETTGTHPASQSPAFDLADFDYNEILVPPMVRSGGDGDAGPSSSLPESSTEQVESTHPPPLRPRLPASPHWVATNWSACSTSCGLGAIWRSLACSTGSDSDCDPAKRPAPAQRCYLRPCTMWKVGEWSKCSKNCEGGVTSREVQCFDLRDQRPLRPFHCWAMLPRPPTQIPCNLQPCLNWYTSSWGQCSEVCGGGEQQRMVTCPEEDRCDRELQPSNIQPCNSQPCAQWLTGSWGQCSASCGGGVQHRLIKCVDTKAETEEEGDQARCDHEPQPEGTQKCNSQECESAPSGVVCLRDRLTFRFCHTLRVLGRCHLANVRAQCCRTCSQRSRPAGTSRR